MISQRSIGFLLVVVVCGGLSWSCQQSVDSNPSEYSDALVVYPRAKDIKFSKYEGTDQLNYRVDEKFPASGVIGLISYKLEEKGWEPVTNDYFNPGLPSSHVKGWTEFVDATKPSEQIVHQWLADWKDRSENIVRYAFHYRSPKGGNPNLADLNVTAVYIPAPQAKQNLEAARKFMDELNQKQKAK